MEIEKPNEGQVVSHRFGGATIFRRRGCGSNPGQCGYSLTRDSGMGKVAYCLLVNPPTAYQSTVDLESAKKKWEKVDDVSCESEVPPITPVSG